MWSVSRLWINKWTKTAKTSSDLIKSMRNQKYMYMYTEKEEEYWFKFNNKSDKYARGKQNLIAILQ